MSERKRNPVTAETVIRLADELDASRVREERLREEVDRLRAWLTLIEARTGEEGAYYALHGYDAPGKDYIERVRVHQGGIHPAEARRH